MNSIPWVFRMLAVVTILLALGGFGLATASQAQTGAPAASAAQSTFCGSQPLCYETADFAATVTDFRTSTSGGLRLIDVDVRFQNKTNQPLILGYLMNSGTALDDRGNRYGVWGANGFRGIGVVYGGTNFDPKFNIRAGSYSDAQFELAWAPGQTPYGLTFELNLSVDEINSIEAGQHTLGGEFPLHYRGLANGVSAAAPGQAAAFNPQGLPPCGAAGTALQTANSAGGQVAAGANTAASNAAAAISNLGSLFGKKKAATPPATNPTATSTASSAPCAPAATATGTSMNGGTSATTGMTPVSTNGTQTAGVATSTTAAPAATAKAATTPTKAATPTAKPAATTTTKPVLTNAAKVTPVPPANAAVKKTATPPPPAKPVSQ